MGISSIAVNGESSTYCLSARIRTSNLFLLRIINDRQRWHQYTDMQIEYLQNTKTNYLQSISSTALYGMQKKEILFSSYRKPLFPREEASVPTKVAHMYSNVDFSHYPGAIKQWARKWLTLKLCFVSSEDWRICLPHMARSESTR